VRNEPGHAAARVIAHLQHRVDALRRQVEHVPGFLAHAVGERFDEEVVRVARGVVVEHDDLGRARVEQSLGSRDDVGGVSGAARFPVLATAREHLAC